MSVISPVWSRYREAVHCSRTIVVFAVSKVMAIFRRGPPHGDVERHAPPTIRHPNNCSMK